MNTDPFAVIPDADPAELDLRQRPWTKPEKTVELVGKSRRKRVDLNPLQRRWFEANGWTYARVETANAWGGMTSDMWGVFDYVAVHPDHPGTLYVQVTTKHNLTERVRKIRRAAETAVVLAAGNRVQVHAWEQPGGKGKRWEMTAHDVDGAAPDKNASTAPDNGQQAPSRVGCGQSASETAAGADLAPSLSTPAREGKGGRRVER